jgi:predicted MFS family arabinose efflux permease
MPAAAAPQREHLTQTSVFDLLPVSPYSNPYMSVRVKGLRLMSHTVSPTGHLAAPPDARRWRVLVLLCLAQFMVVLDVTVVNVALPRMAADLGLDRSALTWVVTAYTLCFGGLMMLGGRLADLLGRRRTFLAGLLLFTAASLAAGLAGDDTMLVAARAAQGLGAALLSPAA